MTNASYQSNVGKAEYHGIPAQVFLNVTDIEASLVHGTLHSRGSGFMIP
jgi:hypothetical protein